MIAYYIFLVFAAFVSTILVCMEVKRGTARDDSDPPDGRSKLVILTDYKTGIQYLTTVNGGMFPRLTRENFAKIEDQMDEQLGWMENFGPESP